MLVLNRVDHRYLNVRDDSSKKQFGAMIVDGKPMVTLERPWIADEDSPSGKPMESCVPAGTYSLIAAFSPKYNKDMYYLVNEDNGVFLRKEERRYDSDRWGCMFHSANWVHQINGCIAPGLEISLIGEDTGVTSSRSATKALTDYLDSTNDPCVVINWT